MSNYFIKGIPIKESIRNHDNIYDFCAGVRGIGGWRFELFNQKENSSKLFLSVIKMTVMRRITRKKY